VDKWQSLENKGGTETEKLRKERIALEIRLREVETRPSERGRHLTDGLEFRDAKIEKLCARLRDYVVRFDSWAHLPPIAAAQAFFLSGMPTGSPGSPLCSLKRHARS
jgi:hypothetical protein